MKRFLLLFFLVSCAHRPALENEHLVTLGTSLDQAQASYLRGCVDGLKLIKVPLAFSGCRDMSILHRQELESIMGQIP